MKKYLVFALSLLLGVFSSCTKEEQYDDSGSGSVIRKMGFWARSAQQTRWAQSDAIGVFSSNENNVKFTIGNLPSDKTQLAWYQGPLTAGTTIKGAYYPYKASAGDDPTRLSVAIPSEVIYGIAPTRFDIASYVSGKDVPIVFQKKLATVKISFSNVDGSWGQGQILKSITLKAPRSMAGRYRANLDSVSQPLAEEDATDQLIIDMRSASLTPSLTTQVSIAPTWRIGDFIEVAVSRVRDEADPVGDFKKVTIPLGSNAAEGEEIALVIDADAIDPEGTSVGHYFATPSGAGTKSGSDWDNALGAGELRELLRQQMNGSVQDDQKAFANAALLDGATFHLSEGDYSLSVEDNKALTMAFTGYSKQVAVSFKGGYPSGLSGTTRAGRDTTKAGGHITAFTGNAGAAAILTVADQVNASFEGLTFKNSKSDGGNQMALRVHAESGAATVSVTSCRFIGNVSPDTGTGAAVKLNHCTATLTSCYFGGNTARNGAALALDNAGAAARVRVNNCVFEGNNTFNTAGAVQNAGMTDVEFSGCTFSGNKAASWGGVFHTASSAATLFKGCVFNANSSDKGAGVMSIQGTTGVRCEDCEFSFNSAGKLGGDGSHKDVSGTVMVLRNAGDAVTLEGCSFNGNTGDGYGGVIAAINSATIRATSCQFTANRALSGWGSAINLNASDAKVYLDHCLFKNNSEPSRGVIASRTGNLVYMNACSFKDNVTTGASATQGSVVHAGNSFFCMHNVSSYNNRCETATGNDNHAFNCDRGFLIVNSTLMDNPGQYVVRVNDLNVDGSYTGEGSLTLCNNIVVSRTTTTPFWVRATITRTNYGHNLRSSSSANGNVPDSSPGSDLFNVSDGTLGGSWSEVWSAASHYGVYAWNGALAGFTPATAALVESAIKSCSVSIAGVTHVGNDFYSWLQSIGALGKDGRGNARSGSWWPGSYQN